MRNFILTALLALFSINGFALPSEDDIFEVEAEGSYRIAAGFPIDLAKEVAFFNEKRNGESQ